jgi:hypothetical protein
LFNCFVPVWLVGFAQPSFFGCVDRGKQLAEAWVVVDAEGATETLAEHVQIGLRQQPDGDDALCLLT